MITVDHLRGMKLFENVPLTELRSIAACAADIDLAQSDWLISEGEMPSFFGCVSGKLQVLKGIGSEQRVLSEYEPGDTFGELPLLLGAPAIASVRALERSRVFRLDPLDFRELILSCPVLNGKVVATMTRRIDDIQREASKDAPHVRIVGPRWDSECHDVRDFLFRNHIPFAWLDPADEDAHEPVPADLRDAALYPVLILTDGTRLVAPSRRALAQAVGLNTTPTADCFDLAIIGAGRPVSLRRSTVRPKGCIP
jgi:thioredoxin reductase (NADPH)